VLPLADAAQRALLVNHTGDGAIHLTVGTDRSTAFSSISELALALLRLVILLGVAVVAEERGRIGINGAQLLRCALGWTAAPGAAGAAPAADKEGALLSDREAASTAVHHASAAIVMIALRSVQFFLTLAPRLANQMHFVVVADGLSILVSVAVTAIRLGTESQSREEDLSVHGGSTWLTDGVLVLLSVSVNVPLHSNIASHGARACPEPTLAPPFT